MDKLLRKASLVDLDDTSCTEFLDNFVVGEPCFHEELTPVIFAKLTASSEHKHEHVHDNHLPSFFTGRNGILTLGKDLHAVVVTPVVQHKLRTKSI